MRPATDADGVLRRVAGMLERQPPRDTVLKRYRVAENGIAWRPESTIHCKAQLTYGIAHPALSPEQQQQQQQVAAQKRIRTSEGNSEIKNPRIDHAYVAVYGKAQHCKVCRDHWAQQRQPGTADTWIWGGCNYSKKGCVPCGKRICKQCWATWDHRKKCTSRSEWKQPPQKSIVKKGGRANRP